MRTMRAVVVRGANEPTRVEDVSIDDPAPGEVLVRIAASGICGSDLHVLHGRTNAGVYPVVLGHEGAGVVEAIGDGVTSVQPGVAVTVSMGAACGRCPQCARGDAVLCSDPGRARRLGGLMSDGSARVRSGDEVLHPFVGLGTLAEFVVVPAHEVVPVPDGVPLEVAALSACGVTTGLGAVFEVARVRPGDTALVVGCGGVGLNVVQGCRLAGASRIVAADTNTAKLDLARRVGATDAVDSSGGLTAAVQSLVPGGFDVAFEVVGVPELSAEALALTRPGGTCVQVGSMPPGSVIPVLATTLFPQRRLLGCMAGGNVPRRDLARIADLYLAGRLHLDELIGMRVPLDRVDEAVAAAESGDVARAVVTF